MVDRKNGGESSNVSDSFDPDPYKAITDPSPSLEHGKKSEYDGHFGGYRKRFFGRMIIGGTIIGIIGFQTTINYLIYKGRNSSLNDSVLYFYLYTLPYVVAIILPLIIIFFRERIFCKIKDESNFGGFIYTWITGLMVALAFFAEGWVVASILTKLFFMFSK